MWFFRSLLTGLLFISISVPASGGALVKISRPTDTHDKIAPKVFIISMFTPEATIWHNIPEFNLLAHNITLPGLSPLFPSIHCSPNYSICQLTTGEGEINAATSLTALTLSPLFNLEKTYFLIAGIAGINPKIGPTSSVTFARFAVQVALQYEIDIRELPQGAETGYIPQGSHEPGDYPGAIYGTEVFEVNDNLRSIAASFARGAELADSDAARKYRALYASNDTEGVYDAATRPPLVLECDTSTSDVYFSGRLLGEAFENTTRTLTSNKGVYCTTQQEDNASLEALLRAAVSGSVDFSRTIIMRTASDFDRPYIGESALENLLYAEQGAFEPAVENLYRAGVKVVMGILEGWEERFAKGIEAGNYVGDVFGTLGKKPDFGLHKSGKRGVRGLRRMRR